MSLRAAYDRWPQYNRRFTERVAALTDEQLAFRPSAEHWPIWAIVGHTAGSRVYWLCHVFGERPFKTADKVIQAGSKLAKRKSSAK